MISTLITTLIRGLLAAFACMALAGAAWAAVDVNKASQAELESVRGIGPGLSGKILKAREAGSFKNWGDLVERVGGIGPANAARFSQAGLTVAGAGLDPSALTSSPRAGSRRGQVATQTPNAGETTTPAPARASRKAQAAAEKATPATAPSAAPRS